jgi:hypothetical protein
MWIVLSNKWTNVYVDLCLDGIFHNTKCASHGKAYLGIFYLYPIPIFLCQNKLLNQYVFTTTNGLTYGHATCLLQDYGIHFHDNEHPIPKF